MIESFVDLTYRGLPLGRRIKLTQVRPSSGYLELPAPMPVGTSVVLVTDEGVAVAATVTLVHEQVGGSERAPGMQIAPALADEAGAAWWRARVALPELEAVEAVAAVEQVEADEQIARPRTRSTTIPEPPSPDALADEAPIDPELLEQLARGTGEQPPIEDDGRQTMMMPSMDLSALGLETGASGQFTTFTDDDDGDLEDTSGPHETSGATELPGTTNGTNGDATQKKPKRRKKRR